MNFRKHLAGLALFSVIVGIAIFINHYLAISNGAIPSASSNLPFSATKESALPVSYHVEQVSLDFMDKKSYTQLRVERQPSQPVPEKLWVTTYYFSPDHAFRSWASQTEVSQPFARSDKIELVTAASCDVCFSSNTPEAGYFARVYVSAEYADKSYSPDVQFDRDITTAVPVVVRWPDDKRQSADTIEKFMGGHYLIYDR
jgi:hypothetical protein